MIDGASSTSMSRAIHQCLDRATATRGLSVRAVSEVSPARVRSNGGRRQNEVSQGPLQLNDALLMVIGVLEQSHLLDTLKL